MMDEKGSRCEERLYNFCHTRDVAGGTSAPRLRSPARLAGLVYWQTYFTGKQLYDGNKM
jgi:hypothetical protein